MPLVAPSQINFSPVNPDIRVAPGTDGARHAAGVAAIIMAMDPSIVRTLSDAAASRQAGEGKPEGHMGPIIQLPASRLTIEEARDLLAGIVNRLPLMLLGPVAPQDPIQTEEGASVRMTEGVAAQLSSTGADTGSETAGREGGATGTDADLIPSSRGGGGFFTFSEFVNLLIALRDLLLKFEAQDLRNGAEMTKIKLQTAVFAGQKQEEAAQQNFSTSVAAAAVGASIGAASMQRTYKSISQQTGSLKSNVAEGNQTSAITASAQGGTRHHTAPSAEMRPASNIDGSVPGAARGNARPAADIQGDLDADIPVMNQSAKRSGLGEVPDTNQAWHAAVMAKSQKIQVQATTLGMMFPAITGTITAGGQTFSQATLVVSDVAKQEADIIGSAGKLHQEQVTNTRALREAIAQLFASLLALQQSTNDHIIQRS